MSLWQPPPKTGSKEARERPGRSRRSRRSFARCRHRTAPALSALGPVQVSCGLGSTPNQSWTWPTRKPSPQAGTFNSQVEEQTIFSVERPTLDHTMPGCGESRRTIIQSTDTFSLRKAAQCHPAHHQPHGGISIFGSQPAASFGESHPILLQFTQAAEDGAQKYAQLGEPVCTRAKGE